MHFANLLVLFDEESDLMKMVVRTGAIWYAKLRGRMLSGPAALRGFKLFRSFSTPVVVMI